MDISGISNNLINNTIDNAKDANTKAADGDFEARLQKAYSEKDKEELKKVCKDFESIMLSMVYKQMKATVPKSELMPSDSGREIFDSMLDDELMKKASESGRIGLADMMYKQLGRQMDATYKFTGSSQDAGAGKTSGDTSDEGDIDSVEETK